MPTVPYADVQKDFGSFRATAKREPVVVTQSGEPAVVILSATEYSRLKELDRRSLLLEDMSVKDMEELLAGSIPAGG